MDLIKYVFVLCLINFISCKRGLPVYKNFSERFNNLAVSPNIVYVGGNSSITRLNSSDLKQVGTSFEDKDFPSNWVLSFLNDSIVIFCNYKDDKDKGTFCSYVTSTSWSFDFKDKPLLIDRPDVKYIITNIAGDDVLLIASSCLNLVSSPDYCYAIAGQKIKNGRFEDFDLLKVRYLQKDLLRTKFLTLFKKDAFIFSLFTFGGLSKLGKICIKTNSPGSKNSLEITPIECKNNSKYFRKAVDAVVWNKYLLVAFVDEEEGSIVCRYEFAKIKSVFNMSRQDRLNCSNGHRNNKIFEDNDGQNTCYAGDGLCTSLKDNASSRCIEVIEDFCDTQIFESVEGNLPISSSEVVFHTKDKITKVGISPFFGHAFVYIGTIFGKLGKVFLSDVGEEITGKLIEEIDIQLTLPILDIQVQQNGQDVFVMTENKVTKVSEECNVNASRCHKCMESNNPSCGWDIKEGRCTDKPKKEAWFLPSVGKKCLSIKSSAVELSDNNSNDIEIEFKFRFEPPVINDIETFPLHCSVKDQRNKTVEKTDDGMFSCKISINTDTSVTLQSNIGSITAPTKVETYKCSEINNCYECLNGKICYWCKEKFICAKNGNQCENDHKTQNLTECPTVYSTDLHIHENENSLVLETRNMKLQETDNLKCVFETAKQNGKSFNKGESAVNFVNDTVLKCEGIAALKEKNTYNLKVKYKKGGTEGYVDKSAQLKVYDCDDFDDCGSCGYRESIGYKCHWEVNGGKGDCNYKSSAVSPDADCPAPKVDMISPKRGPMEGGTLVTITGQNLGFKLNVTSVQIGGVVCTDVKVVSPSNKITCVTGTNDAGSHFVNVVVNNKTGGSNIQFTYVNVTKFGFKKIIPNKGIKSGGRKINIHGTDFGFDGSNYSIKFCDSGNKCIDCLLLGKPSHNVIQCSLKKTEETLKLSKLTVVIDGKTNLQLDENVTLEIVDNPELVDIPKIPTFFKSKIIVFSARKVVTLNLLLEKLQGGRSPSLSIQNINSGGLSIILKGKRLRYVDKLRMEEKDCTREQNITNTENEIDIIKCTVPRFKGSFVERRKRSTSGEPQNVIMKFDNYIYRLKLYYAEDPTIYTFGRDFVEYRGDGTLKIKGNRLLDGATKEMYEIDVGLTGKCFIEEINNFNITCSPPPSKPRTNHSDENVALVVVRVGSYERSVGYIKYIGKLNWLAVIAGTLSGALVMAVVCGTIYVVRIKRKNKKAEIDFEMKLSTIEQKIRETSREEFADAQMTIKDIKSDLVTSRVPFLGYQSYVFNQLFPNLDMETHPLLHEPMITDDNKKRVEQAMDIFSKLLTNKLFLKFLVKTFDSHVKGLSMQDKAQFSSLLSVAVIGNMRLFYQLISCLLEDMIKSANKKQQKLLFRRFESITQRLTVNWLVMTLHDHLQTYGGMQLFMLYKATQTVIEKGPIDAVNINCKYTLAEERLLKTRVDCEPMRLNIDLNGNSEVKIPVEVLDCDTITQVKRKCCSAIYKNKPSSEIPSTDDLELEWHSGKGGKLTLQDVDNISDRGNGMLRLNTLKHYLVKDGSEMALVYKDNTDEMYENQASLEKNVQFEEVDLHENYGQSGSPHSTSPDNIKLLMLPESTDNPDRHKWHLSNLTDEEKCNKEHEIGEIFLNRLFHTKLILKDYIDAAFEGIMDPQSLSIPVRYFLCMLDKYGKDVGVDSDVLQSWKSECYATRVWASLIAKPQLLFDVDVPSHVEPCMDILNQVFIDSFTQNPQHVTKEASSQKLLFCKDIPIYRKHVNSFFLKVEPVTDQQFWKVLDDISNVQTHELKFSRQAVLHQLFKFISKYKDQILDAFEDEDDSKNLDFANKLEKVAELMED